MKISHFLNLILSSKLPRKRAKNEARSSSCPRSRKKVFPTLGLVLVLEKLRKWTSVLASSSSGGPSRTSAHKEHQIIFLICTIISKIRSKTIYNRSSFRNHLIFGYGNLVILKFTNQTFFHFRKIW